MSVSSILGAHEERASQTTTNQVTNDKEMFLKLLVAQLSNQDPLNPQEDKEFIAQLAQFTSLEELQNINGNLETMMTASEKNKLVDATKLVGSRVLAEGTTLSKYKYGDGVYITPVLYSMDTDIVSGQLLIRDSSNNIIHAQDLGALQADTYRFDQDQWDGTDLNGNPVPIGKYEVSVTGKDANGNSVLFTTEIFGDVISVMMEDGVPYVGLLDGRSVKFDDINMVGIVSLGSDSSTDDGDDTTGTGGTGSSTGDGSTTGDGTTNGSNTTSNGTGSAQND